MTDAIPQRHQKVSAQQREERIDLQEIAHRLDPLLTGVRKRDADPDDDEQMLPFTISNQPIEREQKASPRRKPERQTQSPQHHVLKRKDVRGPIRPLMSRRKIDFAGN